MIDTNGANGSSQKGKRQFYTERRNNCFKRMARHPNYRVPFAQFASITYPHPPLQLIRIIRAKKSLARSSRTRLICRRYWLTIIAQLPGPLQTPGWNWQGSSHWPGCHNRGLAVYRSPSGHRLSARVTHFSSREQLRPG